MAQGLATDLATTALLATDKPVMVAPAMNVRMWEHAATRTNMETLRARGVHIIAPTVGDMACGEHGEGRLAEVPEIIQAIENFFKKGAPLMGRRAVVTSGPTFEPVDPVRFIGNRSSGRQGHAIATALARLGAETVLVSGPVALADPAGVTVIRTETARDMRAAVMSQLPADVAVMAAAVSDWRVDDVAAQKIKKKKSAGAPKLTLTENPDILAEVALAGNTRPALVIGFAAETENVIAGATTKRAAKGCDWIVANDVSAEADVFGGNDNRVHLIRAGVEAAQDDVENWPRMSKEAVAERLARAIAEHFGAQTGAAQ
jgi:phosphopantothenoylcysteine decarboxylase/phosphopantothenate--cysteine ligase